MGQNRSNAVMATRVEAHDSLDDFPTPPWATRALIEHVIRPHTIRPIADQVAWEPACNRGHMVKPLTESFRRVVRTDIFDYGWIGQDCEHDFLMPFLPESPGVDNLDWIITNPPFRLAQQFFERAVVIRPREGIAFFVRLQWMEGMRRYSEIFGRYRAFSVHPFAERVPLQKGSVNPAGSTATAYAWFVWGAPYPESYSESPLLEHIPPCRSDLERASDYATAEGVS